MLKYTLRKLLALIPKVLVITIVVFFALELLPGDALTRTMSPHQYNELTETQRDALRESLGLNDPAPARYINWLSGLLHGDLGYSSSTGENIGKMLAGRLPYTIELVFYGIALAAFLGMLLGFLAAVTKNSIIDYICSTISVLGVSLPDFFFGLIWIILFVLTLHWFPVGGRMPVGNDSFTARIPYMVLPILTMATVQGAGLVRHTRSAMLDVLGKEYIKTARSKGLSEVKVNFKHAFRNCMTPIMTRLVMMLPLMVGGSVTVETVFNYAGVGTMIVEALNAGDMPVVMMTTLITAVVNLLASTLVDIVTALLDPRVRFE